MFKARRPPPTTPHPDGEKPSVYAQAAEILASTPKPTTMSTTPIRRKTNKIDINNITFSTPTSSKRNSQPKVNIEASTTTSSSSNSNIPKLPSTLSSISSASIVPITPVNKKHNNNNIDDRNEINETSNVAPLKLDSNVKEKSTSSLPSISTNISKPSPLKITNVTPTATSTSSGSTSTPSASSSIDLMEAMASNDYLSMTMALQSATDREIHAAMLNACARNNLKAVNILISKASEEAIIQASFICARNGHLELLKLLLDISIPDSNAATMIENAASSSTTKSDVIMTKTSNSVLNNSLIQASSKGHFSCVQYMVGLRRASKESLKRSLISASMKSHYPVIEMLIPQVEWDDRRDALVLCCKQSHFQCASLLIEDLPGRFMDQPLNICATLGHYQLIEQILTTKKVSVDDLDAIDIESIIHAKSIAEVSQHWDVVELLSQYSNITNDGEEEMEAGYEYEDGNAVGEEGY